MSANVVGYARVSTHEQDPGAQVEALRAAGAARVFVDHAQSSRRADRPQWVGCPDCRRSGCTPTGRACRRSVSATPPSYGCRFESCRGRSVATGNGAP